MGLEDLATLLLQDQNAYKTENPFYSAGTGLLGATVVPVGADVSPWEKLLIGALAGFGGGVLQGVGKTQAQSENTNKLSGLASLLGASSTDRQGIVSKNPELAQYEGLLEINEALDKAALTKLEKQEKIKDIAKSLSDPEMRTRISGSDEIQEERRYDPKSDTFSWVSIGQGPRFKPTPDSVTINAEKNAVPEAAQGLVAERLAAALGLDASDPRVSSAATDFRVANFLRGIDSAEDINTRAADSRKEKQAIGSIFGYEPIKEGIGRLTDSEAAKYREKASLTNSLVNQLAEMASGDLSALSGMEASQQKALSAAIFNALRQRTGSGAALSPAEVEMIEAMKPAAAAGNLAGAIKAGLLNRDQKALAKYLQERFQEDLDSELFGLGLRRSSRKLESYPAEMLQRYGLSATPQPAAAGPVPGATPAASPTQTPPPNGQMRVMLKDGGTATWDGQGYRRD